MGGERIIQSRFKGSLGLVGRDLQGEGFGLDLVGRLDFSDVEKVETPGRR